MTEPNRRTILKAVAGLPILMSLGAARESFAFGHKFLTASSTKVGGIPWVKIELTKFENAFDWQSFEISTAAHTTLSGIVIKHPNGEFVAYQSEDAEPNCKLELIGDAADSQTLGCRCHEHTFDPLTGQPINGEKRKPLSPLKTKQCKNRVCIIPTAESNEDRNTSCSIQPA